jgi:hypothetical protein
MGYRNKNFIKGLITSVEKDSAPVGSAVYSKNWLFKGDKIETIKGRYLVGSEVSGSGKVRSLFVGKKSNGTEVLFTTRRGYLEYYDELTMDFIRVKNESGVDITLQDVEGSFSNYFNIVGAFTYYNDPLNGMYKIISANPMNAKSIYNSAKNHKGFISILNNACFLWAKPEDKTGQYRSYIDKRNQTTVASESFGTGDGTTKTFNHTIVNGQLFALSITDGVETFKDNYDGTLTGSAGGSGVINYLTGVCSITFNVAPLNLAAITCSYQYEDPTNNGIADFTYSTPRQAAQGNFLRHDGGGDPIMRVCTYNEYEYSFKQKSIYRTQYSTDDLTATNKIFREGVGIPSYKSLIEQPDGVYFINTAGEKPIFMMLRISNYSSEVVPMDISSKYLDLTDYDFSDGVCGAFEDYILFSGRKPGSTSNDIIFIYDKTLKNYTTLDREASCFAIYNGVLLAGDSATNNIYEIMSGYDDNGFDYECEIELNNDDMGMANLKKSKVINFEGEISIDQNIEVYAAYDDDNFELIDNISGRGDYVDSGSSYTLGDRTIGRGAIGGIQTTSVYHYFKTIKLRSPKFLKVQLKFKTTGSGYASISLYDFQKVYTFREKAPRKYQ